MNIYIPRKLINIFIWKEFSTSHSTCTIEYNWESKYPISPVYSVDDLMKARQGNIRSYVAAGCWDVRVELSNHFNEFKITHIILHYHFNHGYSWFAINCSNRRWFCGLVRWRFCSIKYNCFHILHLREQYHHC